MKNKERLTKAEEERIKQEAEEIVAKMASVEIKNPYSKNPLDDFDFEDDDDDEF